MLSSAVWNSDTCTMMVHLPILVTAQLMIYIMYYMAMMQLWIYHMCVVYRFCMMKSCMDNYTNPSMVLILLMITEICGFHFMVNIIMYTSFVMSVCTVYETVHSKFKEYHQWWN